MNGETSDDVRALREALVGQLPEGPGIEVVERPDWVQVINRNGKSVYQNSVLIACFPANAAEAEVDAIVKSTTADYTRLGLAFRWVVGPWSGFAGLEGVLLRNGFTLGRKVFGLTLGAPLRYGARNGRISVETVEASNADVWARTYCAAWGLPEESAPAQRRYVDRCLADPRLLNLVARWDGVPVGIATAAFLRSSAYLANTAVLPEFRGRGVFRSLVEERCRAAVERGYGLVSLFAFEDSSFPILKKMGFGVACESPQYFHLPESGASC